ncbi:MAG: lysylphosphatidylglycerol synthase domain-containing protein [Candidatus Micrarchaeia archaeon]|jgi:uncharacterized membrane protein YbhN (UPF0104 family)
MASRNDTILFALNVAILAGILFVLSSQVDLGLALASISKANLLFLAAAVVAYLCVILVTAARYKVLADKIGSKLTIWFFSKAHLSSLILSDVTPGRVGYAYFAVALGRQGVAAAQCGRMLGVGLALDFLLRAICLCLLALFIAPLLFGGSNVLIAVAICAATVAVVAWLSVKSRRVSRFIYSIPGFGKKLGDAYGAIHSKSLGTGALASSLLLSAAGTLFRGIAWLLVFNSLMPLSLSLQNILVFSAVMAVVTGLTFIPISIAGLGVQEGVGAAAFSALLSQDIALCAAAMLLCRAMEILVDSTGLFWLQAWKKK